MKEKNKNLILYWVILINPIALLLFQMCLKTFAALCMYGGLRKRAPLIVGLGLLLMVWFVLWTIIYHKRKTQEHKKISSYTWSLFLLLEVILLAGMMGYYGKQIVESARPFSGRLSSKIREYTDSKKVTLKHNNIYEDGSRRITTIEEEPEEKIDYEIGKSVSKDGNVYYFQNENLGWRLVIIDAAAGSRWYRIESTSDGGKNWTQTEPDPFPEVLFGVADSIWFFDEKHGFVLMGGASETHSELYYTEDGGFSFSRINLPTELVEVTIPDLAEYDYITMPYLEENIMKVSLRLEKYDCCSIYFESGDLGKTWSYTGVSEEYDIMYQ